MAGRLVEEGHAVCVFSSPEMEPQRCLWELFELSPGVHDAVISLATGFKDPPDGRVIVTVCGSDDATGGPWWRQGPAVFSACDELRSAGPWKGAPWKPVRRQK